VQGNVSPVDLKVLLPDREVVTVTVRKSSNTEEVYAAVIDKIRMNKNASKYFYLFEIVEYNFGKSFVCVYILWDICNSWLWGTIIELVCSSEICESNMCSVYLFIYLSVWFI